MSYHHDHPLADASRRGEFIRLRRRLIRLQDRAQLLRDLLLRKYSPDQPRVPAGNSGGGQWTSGSGGGGSGPRLGGGGGLAEFAPDGGTVFDESGEEAWSSYEEGWSDDGSVFERDIVNRDGSTIRSEYAASRAAGFDERQTVRLASGETITFEDTDRVQSIRFGGPDGDLIGRSLWTPNGPERDATVQPAFAPLIAAPTIILGGAILFNWQSPFNGIDGQQAVMGFEARDYAPTTDMAGNFQLGYVGRLTDEEVALACLRWPDAKSLADRAASSAGSSSLYSSAAVYGTNVHARFKAYVDDLRDPSFKAERSFLKEADEIGRFGDAPYGLRGTIRVDAYEFREDGTLCVYDLKTGRAGLSDRRAEILATASAAGFKPIRRIIVSVIRPKS